ncbi:MAG: hypothetical protein JEZ01_05500 [Labilibaculum sp.]|nr:hypothetical protein [Labilibaculum sp.]MBI9057207.1 hypothetical protein [Labilibaculum sp.]
MKNLLIVLAICLTFVSCETKPKTVHIKGELKNFASEFLMAKGTPEALLLKEGVKITLDAEN